VWGRGDAVGRGGCVLVGGWVVLCCDSCDSCCCWRLFGVDCFRCSGFGAVGGYANAVGEVGESIQVRI
jgi:hypothetical protein